jgi:hypothetical protein
MSAVGNSPTVFPSKENKSQGTVSIWNFDGKIAFQDILDATECFDEKYSIGIGGYESVFRADTTGQRALSRAYLFAESQISGARQRILCQEPALGKASFAESSTFGTNRTSAKPQPHKRPTYAVIFAESLLLGSRQNIFLCREQC